jgi:hypothetical protein
MFSSISADSVGSAILMHKQWRHFCDENQLSFYVGSHKSALFAEIITVRSLVYRREPSSLFDPVDEYSEHYVVHNAGTPVAALRVTPCSSGRLDCEEFMPHQLLAKFRDKTVSATRFVALPSIQRTTQIPQLLVAAAWEDQLRRNIRLDIINVHERAVRYYGKLGYELVAESFFIHPTWRTPSHIMVFPASPDRPSPIQPVFRGINDPCDLSSLKEFVTLASWRSFRRRQHEQEYDLRVSRVPPPIEESK